MKSKRYFNYPGT